MEINLLNDASLLMLHKKEISQGLLPSESSAFDEVLKRYERLMLHIARSYFGNLEDAKDSCQDAVIKVFTSLRNVRISDDENLKAWIGTVTARTCIDALRKRRPETVPYEYSPQTEPSAEAEAAAKERAAEVLAAINMLPDKLRMVIILRDMNDLSYEEIAKTLRINIGTVKSQLNRARLKLSQLLEG